MADQTITNAVNNNVNSDTSVAEWEFGLPSVDELTPLTQLMLPPELASAFSISPVPPRSSSDVTRASDSTISSIRSGGAPPPSDEGGVEDEDQDSGNLRQIDAVGDGDAGGDLVGEEEHGDSTNEEQRGGKTKRQRLVWTPQLHKRFVDVVGHLGIKNAVPKTIMQMMNVEGLTRENVASHLQKYRLYLKRMQDGGTTSATTPTMITSSEQQQGMTGLPYAPMPVYGGYHMMMQQQQQRDWGRSN